MVTGVATQSVGSRTKIESLADWATVRARKPKKASEIMVGYTTLRLSSVSEFISYSTGSKAQKRSKFTFHHFHSACWKLGTLHGGCLVLFLSTA